MPGLHCLYSNRLLWKRGNAKQLLAAGKQTGQHHWYNCLEGAPGIRLQPAQLGRLQTWWPIMASTKMLLLMLLQLRKLWDCCQPLCLSLHATGRSSCILQNMVCRAALHSTRTPTHARMHARTHVFCLDHSAGTSAMARITLYHTLTCCIWPSTADLSAGAG